ncbi:aminotransferase class III-fold pyridoxal phosphate-dependent enzyme [Alicyclobacillus cycloheptanicus]|uniref:Glutamate-1-semialdehyde 2,1-aminomutase n=1 Tax=Alicyclobacillus cycloheptanicus TaxID=1457 RepID=A0ABT9XGW3_9BACL|nr:glutamate-1-semialdehyde 2,1-aminomutase [Alicyclobacillus cycloheptanicus]WDM00185.1 aminotransferase class III-fold pyridoxal phosphate-dependent enzyme [Alicyclobacillus cycloheptanicus]
MSDVDGNQVLDVMMGNGSILFGYADEEFDERFTHYLTSAIPTGVETELSVQAAEKFLSLVPTAEQVRFTNTGTEAILHALMIARTYTGKEDVAVIEGAYNGWSDAVYVSTWPDLTKAGPIERPASLPGSAGLQKAVVDSTLVLPFNDLEAAEKLLTAHHERLAALVLEPVMIDVGFIPARKLYLEGLRTLCDKLNIVLVFDELLTGFRLSEGGAQVHYGVVPDLSIFGKAIANGYVLAAVAGKRDVLAMTVPGEGPCSYVGTFNGHQVSLAASLACLELYEERKVFQTLSARTRTLVEESRRLSEKYGVPFRIEGEGGHFHWYFTDHRPVDYRDAAASDKVRYAVMHEVLEQRQVLSAANYLGHHAISMAHDDAILSDLLAHFEAGLATIQSTHPEG